MPSLKERIDADLKDAMRSKDELGTSVLRMLKSAVKYKEVEPGGHALEDPGVLAVPQLQPGDPDFPLEGERRHTRAAKPQGPGYPQGGRARRQGQRAAGAGQRAEPGEGVLPEVLATPMGQHHGPPAVTDMMVALSYPK